MECENKRAWLRQNMCQGGGPGLLHLKSKSFMLKVPLKLIQRGRQNSSEIPLKAGTLRQTMKPDRFLYQTLTFPRNLQRKRKVLHQVSTPGSLDTLRLFTRLLFRHTAASLAYNQGSTPVSAATHHCQLYDYHDLGRQEYYTATWKEANTWMRLSAQLNHNTVFPLQADSKLLPFLMR